MHQLDRHARRIEIPELVELGLFHGTSPIVSMDASTNSFISVQTGTTKSVHAYISFVSTSQFVVNAYISPTISVAGTPLPIGNFNVGKPNIATVALALNPTVTNNGTKIADFLVPGGQTGTAIGGAAVNATKVILPPNNLFLFEIDNQGTGTQSLELHFNFHEL